MAQARLQRRFVVPLPRRAAARPLRALCLTNYCGLESGPMNEFGEPNMGNPSVRFDEGRERVGHWPRAFHPNRSCLLYETKAEASEQLPNPRLATICRTQGSQSAQVDGNSGIVWATNSAIPEVDPSRG